MNGTQCQTYMEGTYSTVEDKIKFLIDRNYDLKKG